MNKIRAIIIDDEKNLREGLYKIVSRYCDNVEVLGLANSAEQGKQLIKDTNPDLVFLDVQMPEKSGFDMLSEMDNIEFDVIFVTSFDKYAIKAIKHSALDYLLKPINIAELQIAVGKYDKTRNQNVNNLASNLKIPIEEQKVIFKHSGGIRYANNKEIIRCQADGNYCNIYFNEGPNLLVAKTLKEIDEMLPQTLFIRVHQSHLVNITFVKEFTKEGGGNLVLHNGEIINVARSKKKRVLEMLDEGLLSSKKI